MPQHRKPRPARWSRRSKVVTGIIGAVASGAAAFAASNWVVGINSGSAAEGQSASINNLTVSAVASPAASNLLYPGGAGDVVLKITNPNAFPVTVTAVQLPTTTTYAAGYSDSALTTANAGCTATTSLVSWAFATATNGTTHTLTAPMTAAANSTLTVTLGNDAAMGASAPATCANSYFSMPSLTGVTATGGAATATTSPATSGWTS
jgi:hypothetical protein